MRKILLAGLQACGLYGPARRLGRWLARALPSGRRARRGLLAFYAQFIRPGDLVFDVGANLGERTEIFCDLGATVVAVEPQPACLARLRRRFRRRPLVRLVGQALGAAPGEAEMLISGADSISSLSPDWVDSVRRSGRFAGYQWNRRQRVPLTTLDALIAEYGRPVFCKIDVEGFEDQVLRGLTQPVNVVSFEFTPEHLEPARAGIRRLSQLGRAEFNYALGETMRLVLPAWVTAENMLAVLENLPDRRVFGDIYARLA